METQAQLFRGKVFAAMTELRQTADGLESLVAEKHWPLPSYSELLYS